ncbi:MAG TPA: type II secretion system major pseudopilin GspG [Pseudomonadales bacterium]|nr:type II secretion system major pseudopilin GspG [Pseudomonadales bacterium]
MSYLGEKKIVNVARRTQQGFTLIEVMVVIVILGILSALIVPNIIHKAGDARVAAAKSDISAIGQALDMYKLDNSSYPTSDQGLQALVKKPSGSPEPRNWNPAGYLKKLPQDPWHREYIYISPAEGAAYEIRTLGADGREGGESEDQDISSLNL